jgi:DNA polymerase elongation subunit (family B)
MLDNFLTRMHNISYDILGGWNSSGGMWYNNKRYDPGFDMPYIVARCSELGLDYKKLSFMGRVKRRTTGEIKVFGTQLFDVMYWKIHADKNRQSAKLDNVSYDKLKIGKLNLPRMDTFYHVMKYSIDKSIAYNFIDVLLSMMINKKLKLLHRYYNHCAKEAGMFLDGTTRNSRVHHIRYLRQLHGKKVLPSKRFGEREGDGVKRGGAVFEPSPGLYNKRYLCVLDFGQEYPNVDVMLNAGVTTKLTRKEAHRLGWKNYIVAPNGTYYRRKPESLLARNFRSDMDKRNELKKICKDYANKYGYESDEYKLADDDQFKYKNLVNTGFGVAGYPSFPLYDEDVFNSITAGGRFGVFMAKNIVEYILGYKVIYGDTDSIMVELESKSKALAVQEGKIIAHFITMYFNKWIPKLFRVKNRYFMGLEEIDRSFLISDKKKQYIRWTVWKKGIDVDIIPNIKGAMGKKYNYSKFAKKTQIELFTRILRGESKSKIINFMKRTCHYHKTVDIHDIAIPDSINKEWDDYDSDLEKIKAVKYSNKHLGTKFQWKCTPKLIYVKGLKVKAVAIDDTVKEIPFDINWDKMEERNIWNLCEDYLKLLDTSESKIKSGFSGSKSGMEF